VKKIPAFILASVISAPAAAEPLSVSQLLASHTLAAQPQVGAVLQLGNQQTVQKFQLKGFVTQVFRCPECPPDAMCEPCGDFIVLSDAPGQCTRMEDFSSRACTGSLQVYTDLHTSDYDLTPGTELVLDMETSMNTHIASSITPRQRADGEKNQKLLKDVLDQQPGLERAPRPEWLKDIPGESYRFRKP